MAARKWSEGSREAQILLANSDLEARLMQIIKQRHLTVQLAREKPSVSELVDVLATSKIIPTPEGRKSREFADTITRVGDKAARGGGIEPITDKEFSEYKAALDWFDSLSALR